MPVDFRRSTITIPAGTVGPFQDTGTVTFATPVVKADVAINGSQVEYDNNLARHFANLEIDSDIGLPAGNAVDYTVQVELADKTGGESYHGFVTVLVIAEVT